MYRYTGSDTSLIPATVGQALAMVANNSIYYYENPGWGPYGWSCVTYISYCINIGLGNTWRMGSSSNGYFWSPRRGGSYDAFLLNNGFTKYTYGDTAYGDLQMGDVLMASGHSVLVTTGGTPSPTPDPGPGPGPSPYPGNVHMPVWMMLHPWL